MDTSTSTKKEMNRQRGFTFIEAMFSLGIFLAILVGFGALQQNTFKYTSQVQTSFKNSLEVRKVLRPFSDEVRAAANSETGDFVIAEASTSTFAFYSDIDDDDIIEKVRYFITGTSFRKGVISPTGTPFIYDDNDEVLHHVVYDVTNSSDIFSYYDTNYTGTTTDTPLSYPITPSDVRLIKIELTVDSDPNREPDPITVTTQSAIRNLKDNL